MRLWNAWTYYARSRQMQAKAGHWNTVACAGAIELRVNSCHRLTVGQVACDDCIYANSFCATAVPFETNERHISSMLLTSSPYHARCPF